MEKFIQGDGEMDRLGRDRRRTVCNGDYYYSLAGLIMVTVTPEFEVAEVEEAAAVGVEG